MSEVEALRLAHGVPVNVLSESRLRTTSLCLAFGRGGRHDPIGLEGSAHLLEHLLVSTPLSGGVPLGERIESLGGSCNAMTGPETLLVHAQVLNEDAPEVIRLMIDAALETELTPATLASERQVVLQELAAAAADPADVVQDVFLERLFEGHPLGRAVGGTPQTVEGVSLEQIREEHRRTVSDFPVAFAACGGLGADEIAAALARTGLDAATPGPFPVADRSPGPPAAADDPAWPDDFCWLVSGSTAPGAQDPERHAFAVLGHLLGASPASLLYRALRVEDGLSYAFRAWARSYTDTGAWRLLAGVQPEAGPRVVDCLRRLLAQVAAKDVPEGAFSAAVRQARMELVIEAETPLEQAISTARRHAQVSRPMPLQSELAELEAVTLPQVADAASHVLTGLVTVVRPERS